MLEATMILLDNSVFSLNGDYLPSRWEAQREALSLLINSKLDANQENTVGLALMAGRNVQVLVSPHNDKKKILATLHGVQPSGKIHFLEAIQIAGLALKHRINKAQKQRIIAFVASPIEEKEAKINKIGEKLKKNNVAVDLVHFGEISDDNKTKLQGFISKINNSDNSNYVCLEPTLNALGDCLLETAIVGSSAGEGRNMGGDFGGMDFDPNMDPELAMAIRISLEEARAKERQEETKENNQEEAKMETEEPVQKQEAVAQPVQQNPVGNTVFSQPQEDDLYDEEDMDNEEILKRAMELSLQENPGGQVTGDQNKMQEEASTEQFQDPSFINEMLSSVGLDPNDPKMKEALEKMGTLPPSKDNKDKEKKDDSK